MLPGSFPISTEDQMNEKHAFPLVLFFLVLAISLRLFGVWGWMSIPVFMAIRFVGLKLALSQAEKSGWPQRHRFSFYLLGLLDRWFKLTSQSIRLLATTILHWLRIQPWRQHAATAASAVRAGAQGTNALLRNTKELRAHRLFP